MRQDLKLFLVGAALLAASYGAASMTPERLGDPMGPWWAMVAFFSLMGGMSTIVIAIVSHFGVFK